MKEDKATITVVGGGNSAHVLIPFLSASGHIVNLLTRRPDEWNDTITCEITDMSNTVNKIIEGTLSKKSKNPKDVIPDANVIIFCMPVHTQREVLARIGPLIDRSKRDVFIGTIYGQAGFNWMVHEMERENQLKNVVCFAVGLIPWICRTLDYGSKAANYGGKQVNICAVTPKEKFDELNHLVLNDVCFHHHGVGKFVQACSFLSLTLSVDNQLIHPSRCYALWKKYGGEWDSIDSVPMFYRDFDDESAENLFKLDKDYTLIREAVKKHFPARPFVYMLTYLELERLTHTSENTDIKTSFSESKQLGLIKTPTMQQTKDGKQRLDINCRFFKDDIPYGLLIGKWIGEKLNVSTPFLDEVIRWAQTLREESWLLDDGRINIDYCLGDKLRSGIPPSYGVQSVEDILD